MTKAKSNFGTSVGWGLGLLLALCAVVQPARAAAAEKQASFVIDGNSGAVLHAKDADEPRYPASLTKMMTLYLAFEEIAAGRLSHDTMLTMSVACASMAPSKIGLEVGERISLENAMKAVVVKSANDMACAMAEAVAGSEAAFARRMTKRAREIGMTSTTFRNASGLPDPGQISTARDMVTLGLRLRDDFPKHFALFQLRSFSYGGKTYRSHNTLMKGFAGMDGIKTGYTRASGFNLVSSVQRDGKYVVGAVFGGVSASVRNAHMRVILFHALSKAATERTRKAAPVLMARAKPATAPKAPAVAKVSAVAKAPAVKAAAAKAVAAAEPNAPEAAGSADPAIKIAKVKPVMVTGNSQTVQAQVAATPPEAAPRQRPQFVTASATPRLAKPAALGITPATAPVTAPPPPAVARRPGTLDAQSAALAPPAAPSGGSARIASAASGDYLIQVGSFATEQEARKHLETVRGRAGKLLKDRPSRAEQAQVGQRQMFRARFAQFDSPGANAACTTLRQQKVDCLVLKGQ